MSRIREQLTSGPWIAGYQAGDGLAARIAGVMMRVGLPTPSRSQPGVLGEVMAERASLADDALVRLIADRAMTVRSN